jgi:hypothetical protein
MRSAATNPFEPGSDRVPPVWAGRLEQIADWRDRVRPRRVVGLFERGRAFLGEPGIGKSTLVARIREEASAHGDLTTGQIRLPVGGDPLQLLALRLLELASDVGLPTRREERIGQVLRRVRELSVAGAGLRLDPGEELPGHVALTDLLTEIARAAARDGRVVLVHLDELQNVTEAPRLSQLLVALGDALYHEEPARTPSDEVTTVALPVAVYLTGLPEFADLASTRGGATFVRRFATTLLPPISDDDVRLALHPFVHEGWEVVDADGPTRVLMTPDAAEAIIGLCHGDPFLLQLAGQMAWDAGEGPTITAGEVAAGWVLARDEARRHVERHLERLPDLERAVLDTMAALPAEERTPTTIARALGYATASQIGSATRRLDTVRGIITRGTPYTFRARTVEAYLTGDWP